MYIGASLGGCLLSILNGEVSESDVAIIITRTSAPTFETYMDVVRAYHAQGNPFSRSPEQYDLGHYSLEKVEDLAARLYNSGKIHQPRTFTGNSDYYHPFNVGGSLWFHIAPTLENDHPSVVSAYEKYVMLDKLTK